MVIAASREEETMELVGGDSTLERYEIVELIGEGSFSKVYKALDKITGEYVALKKLKLDRYREAEISVPENAKREINILKEMNHPNIINLKEVVVNSKTSDEHKRGVYLVFEFMEYTLDQLADQGILTPCLIKVYT
ncbi:PREDICTED: cell division control protein 2 homolog [Camelina sativa]|uniref:Cell division control protein 2 homolog n=1 Tax=Camelina sativa TaxID=90675 RepID=A0ABM0Y8N4_CAMSA|nr:PREDICTED: cell division control protein 2 homolog [Camelina sativa]